MRPGLDDRVVAHHVDNVGMHGRCEPVGHDESSSVAHELTELSEPLIFGPGVHRTRWLVKDDDGSVPVEGSRKGHALPLSAAQICAPLEPLSELVVVAVRKGLDKLVRQSLAGGMTHRFDVRFFRNVPKRNILRCRLLVGNRILEEDRDVLTQLDRIEVAEIDPVDGHDPRFGVVKPAEQLD